MKKNKNIYFLFSILSIITGFLIYYFLRKNNILIYKWLNFLPKNDNIVTFSRESIWLNFIRYNLPDGLSLLSGLLFLRAIWYEHIQTFLIYKIIFLFIIFLFEMLQIFDNILGTFDFYDLVTMGSIALLESIIPKILIIRRRSCVIKWSITELRLLES